MEQRLTTEQRLEIKQSRMILLLHALHGDRYDPRALCPKCRYEMSKAEILQGFSRDPSDYTTCCPQCKSRFAAKLICSSAASSVEVPFLCPVQTLARLGHLFLLAPKTILRRHVAAYRSAIYHFGSLRETFKRVGREYLYSEKVDDWARKVEGFLGEVPDRVIASVAGVSTWKVRSLRRARGIAGFSGYNE